VAPKGVVPLELPHPGQELRSRRRRRPSQSRSSPQSILHRGKGGARGARRENASEKRAEQGGGVNHWSRAGAGQGRGRVGSVGEWGGYDQWGSGGSAGAGSCRVALTGECAQATKVVTANPARPRAQGPQWILSTTTWGATSTFSMLPPTLTHSPSLTLTHPHALTLSPSLTPTHPHAPSRSLSLSLSLSLSHSRTEV